MKTNEAQSVDVLAVGRGLMALPRCANGHGEMELERAGTAEQAFCGTWYRCNRCGSSALLASPALLAQLDAQRVAHARIGGAL